MGAWLLSRDCFTILPFAVTQRVAPVRQRQLSYLLVDESVHQLPLAKPVQTTFQPVEYALCLKTPSTSLAVT